MTAAATESLAPRGPARLSVTLLALALAIVLGAGVAKAVTDPLPLEQALQGLEGHPRVVAPAQLTRLLPRRQTLYLDCHRLGFSSSATADPDRDRPLTALLDPLAAQQLEVMARFFDVLLADLSFASASEAMAVAYIQFDRASVRSELGQVSELRVLELESVYQSILQQRAASELSQQLTRALLAQALGDPADLPRDLVVPRLPAWPDTAPDLDETLARAIAAPAVRALAEDQDEAGRRLIAMTLRQQVLELRLRLQALAAAERDLRVESAWRDLKLDESRTLYDLEVTADLGYSMSQQTQTRLSEQRVRFCQALTWGELKALVGEPPWPSSMSSPTPSVTRDP